MDYRNLINPFLGIGLRMSSSEDEQLHRYLDDLPPELGYEIGSIALVESGYHRKSHLEKIRQRISLSVDREILFLDAVWRGLYNVVRILIEEFGISPNLRNNYPIRQACYFGRTSVVRLLLSRDEVDPGVMSNAPIRDASRFGYSDVVALLLFDYRVNPSDCGNEALISASRLGKVELVQLLLTNPQIDPSDPYNCSLHEAYRFRHSGIIKLFLSDNRVSSKIKNESLSIYRQLITIS